jgi:hypothetical protein
MKKHTSKLPAPAPSYARASRLTRKPRLASGGFRKGFEQSHIGLCRGEPCGASSAKNNARMPKGLRKASRMQSRFSGLTKRRIFDARFLTLAASLACLPTAHGVILTANDAAQGITFGYSVGIFNNIAIVSAIGMDNNDFCGAAYAYTGLNSGNPTQTSLTLPSDLVKHDSFGSSVGISGDTAIIGASGKDGYTGAAYVYTGLSSGNPTQTPLTPLPKPQGTSYFGSSVGISGDTAIVGAHEENSKSGAVYVFSKETDWGNSTSFKLTVPDAGGPGYFGSSVGISGDTAIVGATGNSDEARPGAVYVFSKGTDWGNSTSFKLTASNAADSDSFGYSVGISGDTAIVGAGRKDDRTGAAYVFFKGTDWGNSTQTILATTDDSVVQYRIEFGISVGISGHTAIVGAPRRDIGGAVYVYTGLDPAASGGQILETIKLTASDASKEEFLVNMDIADRFGHSVGMEEGTDNFIVGADKAMSGDVPIAGKAYTGQVSTFMTVNTKNATRATEGLSFVSQTDWIIGENTDNNKVTLGKVQSTSFNLEFDDSGTLIGGGIVEAWFPDTANVTAKEKGVYIGKSDNANNNTLVIQGKLTAGKIVIGSTTTTGNSLRIEGSGSVDASVDITGTTGTVTIHAGNFITFVLNPDSESKAAEADNPLFKVGELAIAEGTGAETAKIIVKLATNYKPAGDTAFNLIDLMGEGSVIPPATSLALELPALPTGQSWDTRNFENDGVIVVRGQQSPNAPGTPEPSTYALFGGVVLASLVVAHRRRKRVVNPPQE